MTPQTGVKAYVAASPRAGSGNGLVPPGLKCPHTRRAPENPFWAGAAEVDLPDENEFRLAVDTICNSGYFNCISS